MQSKPGHLIPNGEYILHLVKLCSFMLTLAGLALPKPAVHVRVAEQPGRARFLNELSDTEDQYPTQRWRAPFHPRKWSDARQDITACLDDLGFPEFEVEITGGGLMGNQRAFEPSFFPISPKHRAVNLYKKIRHELLAYIHQTIPNQWSMLSLFKLGRHIHDMKPKIVLLVNPLVKHNWNQLRHRLQMIVAKAQGPGPNLKIEIMPGSCGDGLSVQSGKSSCDDLHTTPHQGSSICVQGRNGVGTLGGWCTAEAPNETIHGFLTTSRAVAPPGRAFEGVAVEYEAYGPLDLDESDDSGRTCVGYMADKDVHATTVDATWDGGFLENSIAYAASEGKGREVAGKSNSRAKENSLEEVASCQKAQKDTAGMLGRTILSSGRRLTAENKILDQLPDRTSFRDGNLAEDLGYKDSYILPYRTAQGFASLIPGKSYWKVGRTTGLTAGICNGYVFPGPLPAYAFLLQQMLTSQRLPEIGDTHFGIIHSIDAWIPPPTPTDEEDNALYASPQVILNATTNPKAWHREQKTQQMFSDDGDTGALIMDNRCNIAGLLWGNMRAWHGRGYRWDGRTVGAGLVTDIGDVRASLKTMLGWPEDADVDVLRIEEKGDDESEEEAHFEGGWWTGNRL